MRDTDADWRRIGEEQPYWGVITQPEYRLEAMTPEAMERFYLSGAHDLQAAAASLKRVSGRAPAGGRGLDFGCGVGRLTEAMLNWVDEAVGVDVSPAMLARARARGGRGVYVETAPPGPFDWINSMIVLQHIPPPRGLAIIEDLLTRLAPGGAVSLHLTTRSGHADVAVEPPPPPAAQPRKRLFSRPKVSGALVAPEPDDPPGLMLMHDYDLNSVTGLLRRAGVQRLLLEPTDHGYHGYTLFGRRDAA